MIAAVMKVSTTQQYGSYLWALAIMFAAMGLKLLLDQWAPLGEGAPFLIVTAGVMLAAWFGGLGPGLLATAVGAMLVPYFYFEEVFRPDRWNSVQAIRIGLFVGEGVLISALAGSLHAARRRAAVQARALEDSERQLRVTFEQAPVGIAHSSLDGHWLRANHRFCEITGYEWNELLERRVNDIVQPADILREEPLRRQVLAGERPSFNIEKQYRRSDGALIWVDVTSALVRDSDGQPCYFIRVVEDITRSKAAEERVHQLNRTLEERVAERTAVAEHRATLLRKLTAELTSAEQRERRRLAQLLHDHLQQLLVAAKLRLGLLKKKSDESQASAIGEVDDLIAQSISASRSLTVELSPPILYDRGLTPALEWLARDMKEKHNLQVEVRIKVDAPNLRQELAVFLFQAVRELLFNVVKHAGVTHAEVCVDTDWAGWLCLEVSDEGRGFETEDESGDMPNVIDGLGLFSIRERLELLGGKLTWRSSAGQGTEVRVCAPVDMEADAGEKSKTDRTEPNLVDKPPSEAPAAGGIANMGLSDSATGLLLQAPPPAERTIRVLLVDDHRILREGVATLLDEQPDIEIIGEAADGVVAVEMAAALKPDVVIMDVTLPRLSGIEATRQVLAENKDTCVIGLSMHEQRDMSSAMREAGAAYYLSKGGPSELLVAAIRRCVADAREKQESNKK